MSTVIYLKGHFSISAGETASNLGTAMDELMRHQPTLKTDAMKAIIKVLQKQQPPVT